MLNGKVSQTYTNVKNKETKTWDLNQTRYQTVRISVCPPTYMHIKTDLQKYSRVSHA